MFKRVLGVCLLGVVAGCGGQTTAPPTGSEDVFGERLDAAILLEDEVFAMPNTAFAAMPQTGSAGFEGFGFLIIGANPNVGTGELAVIGDAALTANFSDNSMTGQVDNMIAEELGVFQTMPVNGRIAIGSNESFIGDDPDDNRTSRPNQWYADYAGDLTINGDLYAVEGAFTGDFVGTRSAPGAGESAIKAALAIDEAGFAVVNGNIEESPVVFEVVGVN